jgi:hypothetical protein
MLAFMVGKTFMVVRELEIQTFPRTFRVEPVPVVLIPTEPEVPKIASVFKEVTLAFTVAKTLVAARAFETQTFPATLSLAPPPAQFTPTNPVVETILVVMRFVTFANEVAETF